MRRDLGESYELDENGPLVGVKWILHTADAHDLYRRVGFGPPSERVMERAREPFRLPP